MKKRVITMILAVALMLLPGLSSTSKAAEGTGKADHRLTLTFEFYDRGEIEDIIADGESAPPQAAQKLDPLALGSGQEVVVALRYSGLNAMNSGGIRCIATSFCYDSTRLELLGFSDFDGTNASEWDDPELSDAWLPDALRQDYQSSASVRFEEEGISRIYIQHIEEENRIPGSILNMDDAYIGAFAFIVLDEISAIDAVQLTWADYAVSLYQFGGATTYSDYTKKALCELGTFSQPKNVKLATSGGGVDPDPEGYTITGEIVSYNAKNPITYELYRMGGDGQYETTATYTGTAVEAAETTTAMQQKQNLSIADIGNGTYKLVLRKTACVCFTIYNIKVEGSDVNLTQDTREAVRSIVMAAGDLNGDGTITVADKNLVTNINNYGKTAALANNPVADINGDGSITVADKNIVTNVATYGKSEMNYTVN